MAPCSPRRSLSLRFLVLLPLTQALLANAPAWTVLRVEDTGIPFIFGNSAMSASGDVYFAGPGYCTVPNPLYEVSCLTKTGGGGQQAFAVQIQGAAFVNALALDAEGNAYVIGAASSGFTATPGAYESSSPGGTKPGAINTFVCKIGNADGRLLFCTFIDVPVTSAQSFAVDSAGNTYFAASCLDDAAHVCVEKLNPSGTALRYNTPTSLMATDSQDQYVIAFVAVDSQGDLFAVDGIGAVVKLNLSGAVTGTTYPMLEQPVGVTTDAAGDFQVMLTGTESGSPANFFIHRYSTDLSTVLFDTPLSIPSGRVYGISIDSTGVTNIWGNTAANLAPVHPTAPCSHGVNTFLARIDATGNLAQLTFLNTPNGFAPGSPMFFNLKGNYLLSTGADWEMVFLGPTASEINLSCIASAASLSELPLAPNDIVTLFGAGIGPDQPLSAQPDLAGIFPFQLGGTQVTLDGVAAPLLYASSTQINLVTPRALQGKATTHVCISANSVPLNCLDWPALPAAPDIFLSPGPPSVSPDQNGIITLFLTGLGTMTPSPPDGSIVSFPLPMLDSKVQVVFSWLTLNAFMYTGSVSADGEILYAGPAPLEVEGLSQINVSMPAPPTLDTSPPSGTLGPPSLQVIVVLPDGQTIANQQFLLAQ